MSTKAPIIYEYTGQPLYNCRKCSVQIFFFETKSGSLMPVTKSTGITHFATCPGAAGFRRIKPKKEKEK